MERGMKFIVMSTLLMLLGGCASSSQSGAGHFYHRQEAQNVYVIGFNGKISTNTQRANDFTMLLAAEIGRRLGYTSFVIRGRSDTQQNRIAGTGIAVRSPGRFRESTKSPAYQTSDYGSSDTFASSKPGLEIKVAYLKQAPKGRRQDMYVINEVLRYVKAKYNINTMPRYSS